MTEDENVKKGDKGLEAHEEAMAEALNSSVFIQLAEAYRLQGRYEEAIETCQRGLEKIPGSLAGRLLLGRCYLEKGMYAEAKEELEKVAEGIEECLPVYRLLSQVYLQDKNVDKALDVLRKALYFPPPVEPPKTVTPLEMGLLHQRTNPPFATPQIDLAKPMREEKKTPEEEKASPKAEPIQTETMAEIYIRQGHPDKALSIFQEILMRDPENSLMREKVDSLKSQMALEKQKITQQKSLAQLEDWLSAVSPKGEKPAS